MPGKYRRNYRRYNRKPKRIAPTKKLVTGQTQPTLLEKVANGIGSAATVAKAVLPMIQAINTEMKYIDSVYSGAFSLASPLILKLAPTTTGPLEQNRIGNSILAKDVNLRYRIIPDFSTYPVHYVRAILFVDKQQAGVPPTLPLIMQFPTAIESAFNKDFTDRFAVLKDKRITLTVENMASAFNKIYKKLDFHIRYIGATNADSDMGNNQVYIMWWFFSNTNPPSIEQYTRINFTDN